MDESMANNEFTSQVRQLEENDDQERRSMERRRRRGGGKKQEEDESTSLMQANLARGNIQQLLSNINSVQRLSSAIGTGKDTAR